MGILGFLRDLSILRDYTGSGLGAELVLIRGYRMMVNFVNYWLTCHGII